MDKINWVLLKLEGRLDTLRAGEIETGFYAQVGAAKAGSDIVLIDLEDLTFLSSLGLRILFTTAKMLKKRGIPFAFLEPKAQVVRSALELSGINASVPIYPSLEAAKQKMQLPLKMS